MKRYRVKVLEYVPGTNSAWTIKLDEEIKATTPLTALLSVALDIVNKFWGGGK